MESLLSEGCGQEVAFKVKAEGRGGASHLSNGRRELWVDGRVQRPWGRSGMCDLAVPSKEPGFLLGAMGRHWRVFKAED